MGIHSPQCLLAFFRPSHYRALTNPLEAEREEDLADDPDNETDERTPTDIAENGSEGNEPFEDTNDEGDWDDVEETDGLDSRDTNLSPPIKENDLGDKRDKQATDPIIDDEVVTDTMPMSETNYPKDVADEFVNKSTRFPTDKDKIKRPSKRPKTAQKRKKKRRSVAGVEFWKLQRFYVASHQCRSEVPNAWQQ